ncbi:amino acid ABC transporter permease [Actinotalea ferrariae]|uniref:amino acid ABC transporter permease n=1 Tax=Actinotalea ferrariae TaxID=1386098 RepID=UPI001C8C3C9E|nr:amino acid ABC transporter permease [Actinotalea ferrariae]MBX9244194.1 amino acid ABC transporter permease [Actinotalea ferrariae]
MTTTQAAAAALATAGRTRTSPRRRAQVSRGVQYGALLVVVVVVAATADWGRVGAAFADPAAVRAIAPLLPRAALNTVIYTVAAFAVGLGLGLVLALMTLSGVRVWRVLATAYVEFFRGIPALLVVLAFGYAIPTAFEVRFDSVVLQIALALGLVSAAYIAETLRAGIQAVPRGQVEAARSLGMSPTATMLRVVVPQAFRIVLPPLTNEVVLLLKDTSLVFALGLATSDYELTKVGRNALSDPDGGLTSIVAVGLVYLVLTIPLSTLTRRLERTTGHRGHV